MNDGSGLITLKRHDRIADIAPTVWDACANYDNPFLSHAFLLALEESRSTGSETGWIPQHISCTDTKGHVVAVIPMYIKLHSYGEYVFDQGWAEAFERAGGTYYPKLQVSVPFSPIPGPRILRHPQSTLSLKTISDALKELCLDLNMSSVHITFCTESEWAELGEAGWLQRIGMQYHWHNKGYKTFDDFLGDLASKHRKSIRRERRDANAAGLIFETLRGDDIKSHHWDMFYRFYQSTIDRKWGHAYLSRDFFTQLSERLTSNIVLMMASSEGSPVAGALNLTSKDTLYGRNWGSLGQWPFLHFELCYYRAIDYAIEHGLKYIEAGAQGEHKIQRGYLPRLTYSSHFIAYPGLSDAVRHFLNHERLSIKKDLEKLGAFSPFRQV